MRENKLGAFSVIFDKLHNKPQHMFPFSLRSFTENSPVTSLSVNQEGEEEEPLYPPGFLASIQGKESFSYVSVMELSPLHLLIK